VPFNPNSAAFTNTGTTISRTVASPKAGVWEVDIEASRADTTTIAGQVVALPDVSTYNVTASELGVSIDPASWTIPTTVQGAPNTQLFTFKNLFGAFSGRSIGTAVGSAHDATPTVHAGDPQQQTAISVPAGATNLTVSIGNASDPNADLDLYLFNCTVTPCVQAASSAGSSATEAVSVSNPAAGTWVAVVDLFAIPSGTTTYAYEDIYSKPNLGSITSSEGTVNTTRAHNQTWTATATATATSVPTAGRFLKGSVQVVTSAGAVLGSAPVSILAVTP
jgi:hypothetical protein